MTTSRDGFASVGSAALLLIRASVDARESGVLYTFVGHGSMLTGEQAGEVLTGLAKPFMCDASLHGDQVIVLRCETLLDDEEIKDARSQADLLLKHVADTRPRVAHPAVRVRFGLESTVLRLADFEALVRDYHVTVSPSWRFSTTVEVSGPAAAGWLLDLFPPERRSF